MCVSLPVCRVPCAVFHHYLSSHFTDSSSSHSSVTPHPSAPPPPPPAFPEDDDDFSDFIQGPSARAPSVPSSSDPLRAAAGRWPGVDGGPGQRPRSAPLPQTLPRSVPFPPASQPSTVTSSSQSAAKGNSPFISLHSPPFAHFCRVPSLSKRHPRGRSAVAWVFGIVRRA